MFQHLDSKIFVDLFLTGKVLILLLTWPIRVIETEVVKLVRWVAFDHWKKLDCFIRRKEALLCQMTCSDANCLCLLRVWQKNIRVVCCCISMIGFEPLLISLWLKGRTRTATFTDDILESVDEHSINKSTEIWHWIGKKVRIWGRERNLLKKPIR